MYRRSLLSGFPALLLAADRPRITAVQSGDVTHDEAVLWVRTDRASTGFVEIFRDEAMTKLHTKQELLPAVAKHDFVTRLGISKLPAGADLFYRFNMNGEIASGHLRTAGSERVRFQWSGDTCGQGYGISAEHGGLPIYETMRRRRPDFFLHSGDTIYADGPIGSETKAGDGSIWKNTTLTEEVSKVAETLEEFRGRYRYNLLDEGMRRFQAEVNQVWQWDDHEVNNNYSPGKSLLEDSRYQEKNIAVLTARGRQAFCEYAPSNFTRGTIHRVIPYGPLVDVFVLDMRSFRATNNFNRQAKEAAETAFLGSDQFRWLQRELLRSRAVWKIIAADMPLGLIVGDGKDVEGRARFENAANGEGQPLGRELEMARLLQWMKQQDIRNTVWLTADVHYCAAHYYNNEKAIFTDFDPFWEFVAGPMHAGTFGPGAKDPTFGVEAVFEKAPPRGMANLSPAAGYQFFGEVEVDGRTRELKVSLLDAKGTLLFQKALSPAAGTTGKARR
jgi:alkaline phosphatase D